MLPVRRINISLDTLDEDRFRAITRWGDLAKVMAGLRAGGRPSGQDQCGALRGVNDDELGDMLAWWGTGIRHDHHRGDADGRYWQRKQAGPVSAARLCVPTCPNASP